MGVKFHLSEIFYSIQGEGHHKGTPAVFVRFAGCNLSCSWCDTDFTKRFEMTADQLVDKVRGYPCQSVIFTGGEPGLQLTHDLVDRFWALLDYNLAVETNGTMGAAVLDRLEWVACSPKTGHRVELQRCDELKYVLHAKEPLPEPPIYADHHFLSPVYRPDGVVDPEALAWCVGLVKANPEWRLSTQDHKYWNVE